MLHTNVPPLATLVTHFVEPANQHIQVGGDLAKLVSSEDRVNELHLLDVGEEVPVVEGEVGGNVTRPVLLRKQGD